MNTLRFTLSVLVCSIVIFLDVRSNPFKAIRNTGYGMAFRMLEKEEECGICNKKIKDSFPKRVIFQCSHNPDNTVPLALPNEGKTESNDYKTHSFHTQCVLKNEAKFEDSCCFSTRNGPQCICAFLEKFLAMEDKGCDLALKQGTHGLFGSFATFLDEVIQEIEGGWEAKVDDLNFRIKEMDKEKQFDLKKYLMIGSLFGAVIGVLISQIYFKWQAQS